MSIVLRVNKGSALTYHEMDRNQSSFFYSSSLDPSGTKMRLFYTGSSALNDSGLDFAPDRYQEIPFPTAPEINIPEAVAAGANTQVQFNDDGSFGGSVGFTFNKLKRNVGIGGSPLEGYKLGITAADGHAAAIKLQSFSSIDNITEKQARVDIFRDSSILGSFGIEDSSSNLFLSHRSLVDGEFGKVNISSTGDTDDGPNHANSVIGTFTRLSNGDQVFGIGTQNPSRNISVAGTHGLGISVNGIATNESYLQPLAGDILSTTDKDGSFFTPPNSVPAGLLISSPNSNEGGNIILNINTDTNKLEAFNIVSTIESNFSQQAADDSTASILASYGADGKHSINTQQAPVVGLTIAGNVSSSLNAEFGGTLTVQTVANDASAYSDLSSVGVTSAGLLKKVDSIAAPIPVGGIIMWSGAIVDIPTGWALCNGSNNTPDLRNKFVAGAGDSYAVDATGGNNEITLASSQIPELTTSNPSPSLTGDVTRVSETFNDGGTVSGIFSKTTGFAQSDSPRSVDTSNTGKLSIDATHTHTVGNSSPSTVDIRPAFYALAYIMYVGT